MAITLSNTTVAANTPSGSVIGTFNVGNAQLKAVYNVAGNAHPSQNPATYFAISSNQLITHWSGQAAVGQYGLVVSAPSQASVIFVIKVAKAAPPPPPATTITVNGADRRPA